MIRGKTDSNLSFFSLLQCFFDTKCFAKLGFSLLVLGLGDIIGLVKPRYWRLCNIPPIDKIQLPYIPLRFMQNSVKCINVFPYIDKLKKGNGNVSKTTINVRTIKRL